MKRFRLFFFPALLALCALLLSACGASASSMHLARAQSTVRVADGEGQTLEPKQNLALHSGYHVGTSPASYAWVDLDKVKLTKLDEDGELSIEQEGRSLRIELISGRLFFNVTEPLADDETMEICASSMTVGIRGTCGWVDASDAQHAALYLLEGAVECTAGGQTAAVNAGEKAVLAADGTLTVSPFTADEIPAFVIDELKGDAGLMGAILDASGIDIAAHPQVAFADELGAIDGRILYTGYVDFEADGEPELLVLSHPAIAIQNGTADVSARIYRAGAEGVSFLGGGSGILGNQDHYRDGTVSLAHSGGRTVLQFHLFYDGGEEGSTIFTDEAIVCYGFPEDGGEWGRVEWLTCTHRSYKGNADVVYHRLNDPESAARNGYSDGDFQSLTSEEYEAVRASYSEIQRLAYTTDNVNVAAASAPQGE